jgi:hypothetical protein
MVWYGLTSARSRLVSPERRWRFLVLILVLLALPFALTCGTSGLCVIHWMDR